MTLRKFRENIIRGLMIVFLMNSFLMIICLVFILFTFTPAVENVRDYVKEGRLTLFILGVTFGMFLASLLALYLVNLQDAEEEKSARTHGGDPSRGTNPTPRALRAASRDEGSSPGSPRGRQKY